MHCYFFFKDNIPYEMWGFLQYILPILEQKKSVLSYVFFGMGLP